MTKIQSDILIHLKLSSKEETGMKQKLMGLTLVLCGLASIPIEYDATYAVVLVPAGIALMTTRERIV